MNAKMPELKRCFETAGFEDAKTFLSSGNVVFSARAAKESSLEKKAQAAMEKELGRSTLTDMDAEPPFCVDRTSGGRQYAAAQGGRGLAPTF
jgi:hypothetical protein